ncbi:uncharacterized protein [Henckelia pumila]|uniref:uncharacterized protein n=1 Tax=Henckelia pumila TaxID=405737 RepID=UPI003C6DD875
MSTYSNSNSVAKKSLAAVSSLSGNDISSLQITTHKLNGRNYLQWAKSVKIVISGRGKLGYLTGDPPAPSQKDASYKVWVAENSIVLAWLINSMEPNISRRYLWFQTAKEVWDAAYRMCSDIGNASQIFELRSKLKDIKQGTNSVTQYFSELQDIWQELDLFLENSSVCAECSIKKKTNLDKERVFDFLAGLNLNLDDVRGRVVARDPFPSTEDAFAEVRREEMRRKVMLSDDSPSQQSAGDVSGHTKEKCWEIHGKPANWQPRKKTEAHGYQVTTTHEQPENSGISVPFTKEQIEQIEQYCRLLRQTALNPSTISTVGLCSMTQSGTFYSALSSTFIGSWIIDSGASDYMTGDSSLFSSYASCPSPTFVKISNGSMSPVVGIGNIRLSKDIILKSVFHVPSLTCNLISDLLSGKMIGSARITMDYIILRLPRLKGENRDEAACQDNPFPTPIPDTIQASNHTPNHPKQVPALETGGEVIPERELLVYSRRKPQATKDIVNSKHSQVNEPIEDPQSGTVSNINIPITIRKGVRSCTQHPISKCVSYSNLSSSFRTFTVSLSSIKIPRSVQEALIVPEWRKDILEEMHALKQNNTWSVVELPQGKNTVGCKWIFTVKYKSDGSIDRYKARLVAKGFTQTYGIDYTETFAPVAKLNTVRILLSLAANLDWPLHQLDIKNAFLNGELEEEVYMSQPPGFEEKLGNQTVCKLNKSIYGLKQSPRASFDRFSKVIKKLGYMQGQADHTLFVKHSDEGKITVLIVYVDDIIVTGNDNKEMKNIKFMMAKELKLKISES